MVKTALTMQKTDALIFKALRAARYRTCLRLYRTIPGHEHGLSESGGGIYPARVS
jgi:hypothetical protein